MADGDPKVTGKILAIDWPNDDAPASYANNMVAVYDGASFCMTFCQVRSPAFVGTEEQKQKHFDAVSSVKAIPVARIVVPEETLRKIVVVLQDQLHSIEVMRQGVSNDSKS